MYCVHRTKLVNFQNVYQARIIRPKKFPLINVEILLLADVHRGGPFSNLTDCCERQQGNKVAGFQGTLNNFHGWSGRLAKQRVQNRADQPRVT